MMTEVLQHEDFLYRVQMTLTLFGVLDDSFVLPKPHVANQGYRFVV